MKTVWITRDKKGTMGLCAIWGHNKIALPSDGIWEVETAGGKLNLDELPAKEIKSKYGFTPVRGKKYKVETVETHTVTEVK